jgi:hypothetical protein
MRRSLLTALALAVGTGLGQADVVYLTGGGRIEGEVVEQRPDGVVVEVSAGRITLPRSRIERMVVGRSALSEFRARAAALAGGDLRGWLALAAWARDNDLLTQARGAYEHVLSLDPTNAAAHHALGHVLVADRWLTLEDSYRARGLVQFEGTWVTPEERQALVAERAAYAAQRREEIEAEARIREAEARARTAEAEARRVEAEQQAVEQGGIPYPYVYGGGYGFAGYDFGFPVDVGAVPPPPPPTVVVVNDGTRHDRRRHHGRGGTKPAASSGRGLRRNR